MEHYITIEKYPNYEVSNYGNVRNKITGIIRKQTDRKGYKKIRINGEDVIVHRLVADTFYDGDHEGLCVNHIDGDKSNNFLGNLEWVTQSENMKHAYRNNIKQPSGGSEPIKIIDVDNNIIYDSMHDCAREIGGTRSGIKYSIQHCRKYKNHNLKIYEGE